MLYKNGCCMFAKVPCLWCCFLMNAFNNVTRRPHYSKMLVLHRADVEMTIKDSRPYIRGIGRRFAYSAKMNCTEI